MKVCVVSSFPLLPAHGGNRARTLAMVRALQAMGHDIHFAYLPSRQVRDADPQPHIAAFGAHRVHWLRRGGVPSGLYYVRRAAGKAIRRVRRALKLGGNVYGLDEIFYAPFKAQLAALQAREGFDAVLVQYVSASKAFEAFGAAVLKVLDAHDSFANRHLIDSQPDSYSLTPAQEARGFRRADAVIAIQEMEAARFRAQLGADGGRVHMVSHLLDLSRRIAAPTAAAVFVGSTFDANLASLGYFLDEVLPLVVRARPDFRLLVAGSIGQTVTEGPNVEAIGRVPHVSDAFARGGIAVNPIVKGTGINIKLLDAMAAGIPSVSTAFGARGLGQDARGGVVVVPDADPQAFADAVLGLAADPDLRRTLGARAYREAVAWNDRQITALQGVFRPGDRTRGTPQGAGANTRT